jgi:hypothetical protein
MNGVAFPHESCVVSAKIVDSSRLQLVLTEFHPFQVNNSRNDHRNTGTHMCFDACYDLLVLML